MFRNTDSSDLDLGALFSASPNAYVVFDPDLRIVGCNDAYLKLVNRAHRDDIVGRHVFDAFPADPDSDNYRLVKNSLDRVMATGQPDELALVPYDVSRPGEPPELRYWSTTHLPLLNAGGELQLILQHTTDVTELQRLREESGFGLRLGTGVLNRAATVQRANQAMLAESELMRGMFEQAPGFLAILHGPSHVFQITNAAYRRLAGGRQLVGLAVRDALPELVEQGFTAILDRVRETGEPFLGERLPVILAGTARVLDFLYQPMRDHEGRTTGIIVQGHDLTEQFQAQAEVQRQAEMLRLAQEAGGFGTFEWIVDTSEVIASPAFKRLYGFPEDAELDMDRILERMHPDDRALAASSRLDELDEAMNPMEYRIFVDGEMRWISRQGVVLRDGKGHAVRVLGATHDITQRKQWEAQLETLARESAHRVKNVLTLAQAIVVQTLRTAETPQDASDTISQRLSALASSQTMLVDGASGELELGRLARQVLEPHDNGRIHLEGPEAKLDPRTALGVGLVLHELATNAIKYGALSTPTGEVGLTWRHLDDAVELLWEERGGPPVSPPGSAGFGTRLIERSLAHDPRNRVALEFPPEGVRCTCRIGLPRKR